MSTNSTGQELNQIDMSASINTTSFHIASYPNVAMQVVWDSVTGTLNGTLQVQGSNNNEDWDDIGSVTNVTSATGNKIIEEKDTAIRYMRIKYTKVGITGGNLNVFNSASN